jgi:hypothetical protein
MRDPIMDPEDSAAVPPSTPASDIAATAPLAASEPVPDVPPAVPVDELDELGELDELAEPAGPRDPVATPLDEVGAELVVPEPAAHAVPPIGGVWTDEQVDAVRARVREVTANVADKATGAMMTAVNMVAAAIRSRTSSDHPRDGGQR